jgi:hypothetical protein
MLPCYLDNVIMAFLNRYPVITLALLCYYDNVLSVLPLENASSCENGRKIQYVNLRKIILLCS